MIKEDKKKEYQFLLKCKSELKLDPNLEKKLNDKIKKIEAELKNDTA